MSLWTYRARPIRVVDGDTLYVLVDHGMHIHSTQSVRIAGIDAPEIFRSGDKEAGYAAKAFVEQWLEEHCSEGNWPLLVTTRKDQRSFNRYVATVTATSSGRSLGEDLVAAEHAIWSDG